MLFFAGCGDSKIDPTHCATCHMPIDNQSYFTTKLTYKNSDIFFDDVGCAILYIDKHAIANYSMQVIAKDTKNHIDAKDAHFSIDEQTPMSYGFVAYEKADDKKIPFNLMQQKMLRGENMKNPKIKKQLLGNKE